MENATPTNGPTAAMRQETLDALTLLVYHPRHASDPDRPLSFARTLLARPDLTHATLPSLAEAEALRLLAALRSAFPDRTADVVAKVTKELLGRP